ncbi:hypothetical protein CLOP_g23657 [Closterium sp. NIES-67]|nr:hypothetical protein CLOP_g23657 [Closterium sp. NIES-67]
MAIFEAHSFQFQPPVSAASPRFVLNKLNGSLDAVKAMTSLRDLKLNGNNFKAILPPSFSTLTALTYIDLSYNKFITGHASQLLHLTHVKVL